MNRQQFLKDVLRSLEQWEPKVLIANAWEGSGLCCAVGVHLRAQGLPSDDTRGTSEAADLLGVDEEHMLDVFCTNDADPEETPEDRYIRVVDWLRSETK